MPPILHLAIDQDNKELFNLLTEDYKDKVDPNVLDHGGWSAI